jgi:hypothetical protein
MEIVNLWWILMLKQVSTISPPLPVEQLGFTTQEPILTTGEALEKYNQVAQKVIRLKLFIDVVLLLGHEVLPSLSELQLIASITSTHYFVIQQSYSLI